MRHEIEYGEWFDITELPGGVVVSAREVHVADVPWWLRHVEVIPALESLPSVSDAE